MTFPLIGVRQLDRSDAAELRHRQTVGRELLNRSNRWDGTLGCQQTIGVMLNRLQFWSGTDTDGHGTSFRGSSEQTLVDVNHLPPVFSAGSNRH